MVAMDENIVLKTDQRGRVRTPREQRVAGEREGRLGPALAGDGR